VPPAGSRGRAPGQEVESFLLHKYPTFAQYNRGVARSKTVGWTEGASRTHGERGTRAYNGVRGRSPPLKLKAFCPWTTQTRDKIYHLVWYF